MSRQYDLFQGEQQKREGLDLTSEHNQDWMDHAIATARLWLPRTRVFQADEIRGCVAPIAGEPKHPNAWGALTRSLISLAVIRPTGDYKKSRSVRNHAHPYQTYWRV